MSKARFEFNTPEAPFEITVAGTVDHRSMGGWKEDPQATYNPTISLGIANEGDCPVVNPRIVVDGGKSWFDIRHIVDDFAQPGMNDQEKAFALWQWCRRNISGGPTFDGPVWGDTRSMTRFMNAFGTGACGTYHIVMPVIGMEAGLRTFSGCFANCSHAVQHEWYDGQDRYFDAHIPHGAAQPQGWFALKLNNREIAGVADIMEDRHLIERAGSGPDRYDYVAYFGPGSHFSEEKLERHDPHRMALTLRPGESIRWSWSLDGPAWQPDPEPIRQAGVHCSGRIDYTPRIKDHDLQRDAVRFKNLRPVEHKGRPALQLMNAAQPGEIVYQLRCPYPITGIEAVCEQYDGSEQSRIMLACSLDGNSYIEQPADEQQATTTDHAHTLRITDHPQLRQPNFTHTVWFRVTIKGGKTLVGPPRMSVHFQAYRPSLPSLYCGRNRIRFQGRFSPSVAASAQDGTPANWSFEEQATPGQTPHGWTAFGKTDGVHLGRWYAETEPIHGNAIFAAASHYTAKDGGIYQQVDWPHSRRVSAAVYIATPGDSTAGSGCRIGLDPAGGTDPDAETIVWSPFARGPIWKRIETGPVNPAPDSKRITVFLHHKHALDGHQFNVTGFDACVLEDADAAKPAPSGNRERVCVEYAWNQMPDWPVPKAPSQPVHPADRGRFGFNESIKWSPAVINDDEIDNHEIYISPRADLAWPVMPNTHHITGCAEQVFRLIAPDVLRDGATYYWRVRARSKRGVWGNWSDTWSFVAAGPNTPAALKAVYDAGNGSAYLSWKPPESGEPVEHYEVYASGEHGFSPRRAAESAYMVGRQLELPANLIAVTKENRLEVTERTEVFFRIASVDKDGNRSVVTPIASLPSPVLLPVELPPAEVGRPYKVRLPARLRTGRYARSLKKGLIIDGADEPTFSLASIGNEKSWFNVDPKTGKLSGTPTSSGTYQVSVNLEDGRGGRSDHRYLLNVR